MKFLVLSLLVVACSAVPYNSYSSNSYQSGVYAPSVAKFGSYGSSYGGSSFGGGYSAGAPRIALLLTGNAGLNSGYSGYSGISSGLTGGYSGLNYGNLGYSAAAAAPTYQIVQAAPSVQTVALQAAPAVQTIALAAQPSYQAVNTFGVSGGFRQQQQAVSNFEGLTQHRSDNFEQVVPAAIQQVARTVEYRHLANQEQPIQAQVVDIEPSDNPVHLNFKTRSSTLSVSQAHTPAQPVELKSESAVDEPQRLSIEVQKPVIQNVREVITPYRQVEQEILPVQESLHTIVSKGDQRQQYQGHQQQVSNYGVQQNTYAAVQAVQPVQTIAVQAAPAVQTVAVQPIQVAAVEHVAAATPAVAHYQTANYVQAAPAVTTLAIQSQPSASFHSTGGFQSTGSQYGARFHSASAPISTSSYSSSSSSSSGSYKPLSVSKFQKDGY